MKLGDIYKHKTEWKLIQIDCFATHMGKFPDTDMIIIFSQIYETDGKITGSPSQSGYGSEEEIEKEYELVVPQEKLSEFKTFYEVFKKLKKQRGNENERENKERVERD